MIAEAAMVASGAGLTVWAVRDANGHHPGTSALDRAMVGVLGAVGVMLIVAVPLARLPVLHDVSATLVAQSPTSATVHVVAAKHPGRALCTFQRTDAFVTDADGVQVEVPRAVAGDPYIGNTRPAGRHDFGLWTVTYPPTLRPVSVAFFAKHECAWWMQTTVTQIGPVLLP
jgi:hypothetical protein